METKKPVPEKLEDEVLDAVSGGTDEGPGLMVHGIVGCEDLGQVSGEIPTVVPVILPPAGTYFVCLDCRHQFPTGGICPRCGSRNYRPDRLSG